MNSEYPTEAEAKRKWCPFVRRTPVPSVMGYQPAANRFGSDANYNCLGSMCMAWRWIWNVDPDAAGFGPCGYCSLMQAEEGHRRP